MPIRYVSDQGRLYLFREEIAFQSFVENQSSLDVRDPAFFGAEYLGRLLDVDGDVEWKTDKLKFETGHLPGKSQCYPWTSIKTDYLLARVEDATKFHPLPWKLVQYPEFGGRKFIASAKNGKVVAEVQGLNYPHTQFLANAFKIIAEQALEIRRLQALVAEAAPPEHETV